MKGFGGETDSWEGPGIDGRIMLKWILSGCMNWIDLA